MTKAIPRTVLAIASTVMLAAAVAHAKPANVLLIITDEHNFRTLGCYRDQMTREQAEMWGEGVVVPTPNIDRIAKEGVICTRAYATAPVCSPCRAAMITGRYPQATGVPTNNKILDRSIPTLADRLNQAGYRTGFIGKWHLGGNGKPEWSPKVDGGFQFKEFMFNRGHWKKLVITKDGPAVGSTRAGNPNYDVGGADETTFATDFLTDRAIEFITDSKEQSEPFFAVISYPDPHGPNTVRAPYDHRFDDLRFAAPRTYQTGIAAPKWLASGSKHPTFRGADMSRYFGMVQCIDDNLGKLFGRLEETGQLDDTLIVMTSDHGDLCFEHDRLNKGNPYEGSARVPMLLRHPELINAGQVYRQPMGTVDVTPTVMGLLGLDANEQDHGRDLSDALTDVAGSPTDPASQPITFLRNSGEAARWVAAVDSRYKLILSINDRPWLFDIDQDPDELLNFYRRPGNEGIAERLARALREYGKRTEDPFLTHPKIASSLAEVLGEAPPGDLSSASPTAGYRSDWNGNRRWIGPDWWANPMTDWSLRKGQAIGNAAKDRTLCLLPAVIGSGGDEFRLRVSIQRKSRSASGTAKKTSADKESAKTRAGFRVGRRGGISDYRHALVHATTWIDATIAEDGRLKLGEQISDDLLPRGTGPIELELTGSRQDDAFTLELTARRDDHSVKVQTSVPDVQVLGGVSLLSDGPSALGGAVTKSQSAFRDFRIDGDAVVNHQDWSFGPILWTQYTLSRSRLRLQMQLAPLGPNVDYRAQLWVASAQDADDWQQVSEQPMAKLSRTVTFTVDDWDSTSARAYQVRFPWKKSVHVFSGVIRREPGPQDPFRLACFSCDNGYLFPIPSMVDQVSKQDPDMLFFAGDQIYESYGGFGVARNADVPTAMLDYLRKFYQFGWTWRDVMRDRPSVVLPDDHDVFQGNLWGHGGRKLPTDSGKPDWTYGGYLMPGQWVAAVETTNVGHLPDPADELTLPIGIGAYYTDMVYGGIGFAILEDRKFKTGPKSLPDERRATGQGGELLGASQESFLRRWAEDWEGQKMKCALSQTIFCNAATHSGQELKRSRGSADSGGWPIEARNRAVRILGSCNAFAIHGDQHLGILLRHGVDDFDDAGYAFMVPGTANGFPRAWWPGIGKAEPKPGTDFTGKFRDDLGHPIHVLAVGNPEPGSNRLPKTTDPMEIGRRKGSGYGIVDFDRSRGDVTVTLYRLGGEEEPFDGFPLTVHVGGRPVSIENN